MSLENKVEELRRSEIERT